MDGTDKIRERFEMVLELYPQNSGANKTLTYWKDVAVYYYIYSRAFHNTELGLFHL